MDRQDISDEGETVHAERPGQHGDESAELVAKKVLHQRAVRSCVAGHFTDLDRVSGGHARAIASAAS
jgi:hypothetical protein